MLALIIAYGILADAAHEVGYLHTCAAARAAQYAAMAEVLRDGH